MTRRTAVLATALLLGCGSLPTVADNVAILEITPPASLTLNVGQAVQFSARTLDKAGKVLEVPVTWSTPDTTLRVDAGTGLVTGIAAGSGRVQASVGTAPARLASDYLTLTVVAVPAAAR